MSKKYKAGIVGGTGYTGVELLRLLAGHPDVEVSMITSRGEAGVPVADLYPNLRGIYDLRYEAPDAKRLADCDIVFFATPHAVAMNSMRELIEAGARVVDLSADFRLKDTELWAEWYGQAHVCPDLVADAVYGLPELQREKIASAQLVAAAGCYPTSVQLGLAPLLKAGVVDVQTLIANAASGISGAGRQAKVDNLLAEASDSFKAYAVPGHRHLSEIEQGLTEIAQKDAKITFVPHLLPIIRGIHATLYAQLIDLEVDIQSLYEEFYADEPFVDVLPAGMQPQTRFVKGSNKCQISLSRPQQRNTVVVSAVIDNLVKGASGQAIQCMNIMLGLDESTGLGTVGLTP
jgi:N-acetyl-gamma-glutamyl-phosphate reductase